MAHFHRNPSRPSWHSRPRLYPSAFSLIELLVVFAITAVLAAIVVPRFGRSISLHRIEVAARRVSADLTLARHRARMTSAAQIVRFVPTSDSYELIGLSDMDHSGSAYVVSLKEEPYGVRVSSAVFGNDSDVIFDGYGRPDSGGTVIIRAGDLARQIDLDAETGKTVIH